ncbi:hypothetical protein PISL3812_00416 [Talaromyces islandicus]|uniref:Uncharacterized protein n=1 Tax=Talaromyces islandicus TaxID=28573 RepID=A0A0U1LJA0_TALIS|nr:hypothetical protein PISL3812_00416 [Talaromyces islandicus]
MAVPNVFTNPESLTALSDTVNQTLIDTGRFFKSSGSFQSRVQLKKSIPASYDRFQIALDTLSEQIFIAKAFLESDYETIIAKKASPKIEPASTPLPAEDVTMSDAPPQTTTTSIAEPSQAIPTEPEPDQPEPPLKMEAAPDVPETLLVENPEPDKEKPAVTDTADIKNEETTTTKSNDQALPATTGDELNFDSMLATDGTSTNEFDLNFNFGNDEIGNQNFLDGTNFLASGNSMAEGANNNDQDPNSISSLLPGLESYAADNNAGGDFNLELQKLNDPSGNQAGIEGTMGQDDITVPGESNFDDLFLEKDNLEGEDNLLGGDGLMGLGELEDNWFN